MFRRSESAQLRMLLRLIESQQRIIESQNDRLMYLAGQTWTPPPQPEPQIIEEEEGPSYSAFHGLPPTEEWDGTESP